jgi:hypothetical protein
MSNYSVNTERGSTFHVAASAGDAYQAAVKYLGYHPRSVSVRKYSATEHAYVEVYSERR